MWEDCVAPPAESFPGTTYATSTNGWIESNIFRNYFEKSFLEILGTERPVLLIYDGHVSHVDERLIRTARENDIVILKLPPHSSHILQPLDLIVFKSLKVKWDQALIDWQRRNEGRKIPKKKFSSLIGKIWKETSQEIICNGFKKAGIFPYNREVVTKEQYDPLALKTWEEHLRSYNTTDSQSVTQDDAINVHQEQDRNKNLSFEELLLSTVRQANPTEKVRKRRIASGAEVITSDEVLCHITSLNQNIKSNTPKMIKNSNKIISKVSKHDCQEEIIFDDSNDDVEEEIRESEALEIGLSEIDKPLSDIAMGVVGLAGKKTKKFYVGQVAFVVDKAEALLEIKFVRKVPTLDPLSSLTFSWKDPEEYATVSRNDIILSLPKPSLGRRGLIKFDINFSSYNVQ